MKLSITVKIIYPDYPPTEDHKYPTRHVDDVYEQSSEIEEPCVRERLENIIKSFNAF